jgi:transposase
MKEGKEPVMEQEQRQAAKRQMLELMQAGQPWRAAAEAAGIQVSRSTAYRWQQEVRTRGEAALQDGRHGHPAKVLPRVLHWLESRCQATPQMPSSELQRDLQEQLGVLLSISHLNTVRVKHGWSNSATAAGKKTSPC